MSQDVSFLSEFVMERCIQDYHCPLISVELLHSLGQHSLSICQKLFSAVFFQTHISAFFCQPETLSILSFSIPVLLCTTVLLLYRIIGTHV